MGGQLRWALCLLATLHFVFWCCQHCQCSQLYCCIVENKPSLSLNEVHSPNRPYGLHWVRKSHVVLLTIVHSLLVSPNFTNIVTVVYTVVQFRRRVGLRDRWSCHRARARPCQQSATVVYSAVNSFVRRQPEISPSQTDDTSAATECSTCAVGSLSRVGANGYGLSLVRVHR